MARTIPAAPGIPADPRKHATGKPIRAGSATLTGHWLHLGQMQNLAASTGLAQPVIEQGWADGQFDVNTGGLTEQCVWRIPYLSERHTDLAVHVLAKDIAGAPTVRLEAVNAANTLDLSPAGGTWTWYTGTLDASGGFGPHAGDYYEDIKLHTNGDVEIRHVMVSYVDIAPGATYPGADDAHAAGPFDGFTPIDDLQMTADEALPSHLGVTLAANITALATRERMYGGSSAIQNVALASGGEYLQQYFHPVTVPIQHMPNGDRITVTVWAYVQNSSGAAWNVYLSKGPAGQIEMNEAAGGADAAATVEVLEVASAGAPGKSWHKVTFEIDRVAGLDRIPPQYVGLAHLGWHTDAQTTTSAGLISISIFGA